MSAPAPFTRERTGRVQRRYDPRRKPWTQELDRCLALMQAGEFEACLAACAALTRRYGPNPHASLIVALLTHDRLQDKTAAHKMMEEIVRAWPGWVEGRYNLGALLASDGRWIEARHQLRRAHTADPEHVLTLIQLGICEVALGNIPQSREWFALAMQFKPRNATEDYRLMPIFAFANDFDAFWTLHEARWQGQQHYSHDHGITPELAASSAEIWDGIQPLGGRTILVLDEQGAGDIIQFMRYLPWLVEHAARVYFRSKHPALRRLVEHACPGLIWVPHGEPLPMVDYFIGILSLHHRLVIGKRHFSRPPQNYVARTP